MNPPVLEFSGVSKSFGAKSVLRDLSFAVGTGEFVALLGPNGAGKSTAISLATGLGKADSGSVKLFGNVAGSLAARAQFAYVPQDPSFPAHVTPRQILKFMAAHYPTALSVDLGVAEFMDTSVRVLSGGQKRLLAIAQAFTSGARFVILDEPTVGLDLEVRRRVWDFLRAYVKDGGSLLVTTHYLLEAELLADRIVVLAEGRALRSGTPAEIKKQFGFKRISFIADEAPPFAAVFIDDRWTIDARDGDANLREVVAWPGAREIEVVPVSLEDVFAKLVRA